MKLLQPLFTILARLGQSRTRQAVLALALLALLLRAWGLDWGLPHSGRFYPYHPDESVLLHAVCQINPLWGDFKPSFYNYGTLYIFLCRLAYDLTAPFAGWGPLPRFNEPFPAWVQDFSHLLLTGRVVTVALGSGTVLLTAALGRVLFGRRVGWLSALFLAVAPMPVLLGHYMTVDVPAAFFTTAALLYAAAALRAETSPARVRMVLLGAALCGLAAGTKYNCFPALFALAVPLLAQGSQDGAARKRAVGTAVLALAVCGLAFLVATPGALLETNRFIRDLMYEIGRNREGQGLIFRATPPAILYHLSISFPVGLEWPLWLLSAVGVVWSLRQFRPEDRLLLLFLLPYFLLLAPAERKFLRYVVPLLPPLLVLAARAVDTGLERCRPVFWRAWAGVAVAAALASTVAHLGVIGAPDSRDQAADYLRAHTVSSDVVALGSDAWFYTPPIDPSAGCVKVAMLYGGPPIWDRPGAAASGDLTDIGPYRVLAPHSLPPAGALRLDKVRQYRPRYVVVTDFEYDDPERIRRADPRFHSGILELLEGLRADYSLEREFRPRPALAGFTWWHSGVPPHDWRYYMPTVRLYARRG